MNPLRLAALAVALLFLGGPALHADDSTPVVDEEIAERGSKFDNRWLSPWLAADLYHISFGESIARLRNPTGFDVDPEVFDTGQPFADPSGSYGSIAAESHLRANGRIKSVWRLRYDSDDFRGLNLRSLMANYGWSLGPRSSRSSGARLAAGLGAGLTRSSSFFDSALHPTVEAWAGIGLQIRAVLINLNIRERAALGANLDGRRAEPRTTVTTFSIGFLFDGPDG